MSEPSKRRWSRFTFSLRTLIVVTMVLGAFLGYPMNWIHQRRTFLAEQLARQEAAWNNQEDNPYKEKTIRWWQNIQLTDERAPWLLWLFGERAVGRLLVVIPEKDITHRNQTYEMCLSQPDFQRAKQLFPEAEIHPIRWSDDIPRDSDRWFFEIQISN